MTTQFNSEVAQKLCEVQEQVVIELIQRTGFNTNAFDLKNIKGARYAIEAIKEKGYFITQTKIPGALEVSYILQRHGEIIAQRYISVKIKASNKVEEKRWKT